MSQVLDANLLMEAMHLGVKEFIPLPIERGEVRRRHRARRRSARHGQAGQDHPRDPDDRRVRVDDRRLQRRRVAGASSGKTVLLDLDLIRGGVASYFDIRPRYTIADVMDSAEKVDKQLLDNALVVHQKSEPGDPRPAGPARGHAAREPRRACARLLGVLGRMFDYVVIDSVMSIDPIYADDDPGGGREPARDAAQRPQRQERRAVRRRAAADGHRGEQDQDRRQPLREEGLRHRARRGRAGAGAEDRLDGPQRLQERDRRDQLRRAGRAARAAVEISTSLIGLAQHARAAAAATRQAA